ncbi:hypothetical protein C7M84_001502 [Penaeus vannamei]|uniref:Uncharacterized protein n=1 Tax=Penaeus vannamei TaxID=6689 RepID=A0A423TTJ3_PENVA|nr:hypothetical protein C7M84_001502 [Penaeus vannamei]
MHLALPPGPAPLRPLCPFRTPTLALQPRYCYVYTPTASAPLPDLARGCPPRLESWALGREGREVEMGVPWCLGAGDRAGSTKGQRREVIRPRRFGGKARAGEPTMGGRNLRTMAAPFHYLTDFRGYASMSESSSTPTTPAGEPSDAHEASAPTQPPSSTSISGDAPGNTSKGEEQEDKGVDSADNSASLDSNMTDSRITDSSITDSMTTESSQASTDAGEGSAAAAAAASPADSTSIMQGYVMVPILTPYYDPSVRVSHLLRFWLSPSICLSRLTWYWDVSTLPADHILWALLSGYEPLGGCVEGHDSEAVTHFLLGLGDSGMESRADFGPGGLKGFPEGEGGPRTFPGLDMNKVVCQYIDSLVLVVLWLSGSLPTHAQSRQTSSCRQTENIVFLRLLL